MSAEPEPRNGSRTMSPRWLRARSASSSMATGLTVGCSRSPRRASEPSDEAPGFASPHDRTRELGLLSAAHIDGEPFKCRIARAVLSVRIAVQKHCGADPEQWRVMDVPPVAL